MNNGDQELGVIIQKIKKEWWALAYENFEIKDNNSVL
jgi:hypothetical protein